MWERLWDIFVDQSIAAFMPLVCSYYVLVGNPFLNTAAQDATGLEKAGNILLVPFQYICAGREAIPKEDGTWEFIQRFDYSGPHVWPKTFFCAIALPPSLILGCAVKGASFLQEPKRKRHQSLQNGLTSRQIQLNVKTYEELGLFISAELSPSQGYTRRPGDERHLEIEKKALQEITHLLNEKKIPWWVDCGTCLGTYRYGGVIPWDSDLDIAVLLPDFENVRRALFDLDPKKYIVQDWSTRECPKSYIKVFIRESGTLIDIYHFAIDLQKKEIQYILSLDTNAFFPEWWKIRERRFTVPVAFETVFPLKKALFDGIEVFIPNNPKKYLQRYYGENLDPAKIYDPLTDNYEKDLSHPYWQRAYVH
ncbi:MAG TPA: LicD family protein [Chlamydiales bacterium]|nr:LicD family protein [Chlamydiales bacterium]